MSLPRRGPLPQLVASSNAGLGRLSMEGAGFGKGERHDAPKVDIGPGSTRDERTLGSRERKTTFLQPPAYGLCCPMSASSPDTTPSCRRITGAEIVLGAVAERRRAARGVRD